MEQNLQGMGKVSEKNISRTKTYDKNFVPLDQNFQEQNFSDGVHYYIAENALLF